MAHLFEITAAPSRERHKMFFILALLLFSNCLFSQDSTRAQFFTRPESPPQDDPPLGALKNGTASPSANLHDNVSAQPGGDKTVSAGPFAFKVGLMAGLEYNDNVRVEPVPRAGLLASAGVNLEGAFRISSRQELMLLAVLNQRMPLSGPGKSERLFSVAPNSVLRFQVWVRSLRLTPFVKYSRQLDPVLSPVVNGTRILDQAAFTKGLQADLPLSFGGLQLIAIHDRRSQKGDVALSQTSWTRSAGIRGIYNASAAHTLMLDAVLARITEGVQIAQGSTVSASAPLSRSSHSAVLRSGNARGGGLVCARRGAGANLRLFPNHHAPPPHAPRPASSGR